jgi:phosphonopyruvate decarboxylase
MIDPARFFDALATEGVQFVAGVPDSLLKEACRYVDAALPRERHVIAANEGGAVALAAGHHLATGAVPLVYLQNSGIGNAVNPLLSLVDPEVYAIPLVLLIGWRGEPGVKDEPQHVKQGRVTPAMLDAMEIPYRVLDGDETAGLDAVRWAVGRARERGGPTALLARKGAFAKAGLPGDESASLPLTREAAIERVVTALQPGTTVVATTGMIARELYEFRRRAGLDGSRDFLTVGSMGHASQIALGIASARPAHEVACLDGDGAALMHLGGLATIGVTGPRNFLHVVLNNGAHDSVGGQPTAGFAIDLPGVARACGYAVVAGPVEEAHEVTEAVQALQAVAGPAFLEVRVARGARSDLGRPKEPPVENVQRFVTHLREEAASA